MLALIDGDILVYRIGFTTEDVDETIACWRLKDMVDTILLTVGATSFKIFLTEENDPNALRRKIYPEYKANRQQPKPKHYQGLRSYLQTDFAADICTEIEADDALGMTQIPGVSIIVSIDKDLKQIPGDHYNFVTEEFDQVSIEEGLKYFYTQLLTGDSSDNVKGVWKVGPVKARALLQGLSEEQEMFNKVRATYGNDEEMLLNGRVLWIWKQANDDWRNHWNVLSKSSEDQRGE